MKAKQEKSEHAASHHGNNKLLWGLLIGAAVGVAIGGVIFYAGHKDISIVDEIDHITKEAKKKVSKIVEEGLDELEQTSDKIRKSAKDVLKKASE